MCKKSRKNKRTKFQSSYLQLSNISIDQMPLYLSSPNTFRIPSKIIFAPANTNMIPKAIPNIFCPPYSLFYLCQYVKVTCPKSVRHHFIMIIINFADLRTKISFIYALFFYYTDYIISIKCSN